MKTLFRLNFIVALFISLYPFIGIAQWLPSNNGLTDTVVYALEYNHSKTKVFAGSLGSGVFTSIDNGVNWQSSNAGITNDSIVSMAYNDSLFFVGTHSGLFKSNDDGSTWQLVNQLPQGLTILSICINGSDIFIGTDGNGVFYSPDLGSSWNTVNSGLSQTALNVTSIVAVGNILMIGTIYDGVYKSVNNGLSWSSANSGLGCTTYMRSFLSFGNKIFVGTQGCGIYSSSDFGNTWTSSNSGLTNLTVIKMIASGNEIYAATFGGGVNFSSDSGNTWSAKNSGLNMNNDLAVNTITTNGSDFLIGTFGSGAFRWQIVNTTNNTYDFSDNKIKVFPNPSTQKIHFNSESKIIYADLVDGKGLVSRFYFDVNELDISSLPNGKYNIIFYGVQNKIIDKQQLIKQ
ncbi:MAG: WD40/YVTN/BNR-like repeat-containing protein [Bacteroidota bacterium]